MDTYELTYQGPRRAVNVVAKRAAFQLTRKEPRSVKLTPDDLAMIRRGDCGGAIAIVRLDSAPVPSLFSAARAAAIASEKPEKPAAKKAGKKEDN